METEIELNEAFQGFLQPARYKAFHGGRGSGKSHAAACALVTLAVERPIRALCCREIQKSIKDSSKRLIDDKITEYGLGWFFESTETEIRGKNGSLFLFAGLKTNPEAVKSMEGIDIAWVEEADRVSRRSLDLLIPTIRKPNSELWFTWNRNSEFDAVDLMFSGPNPPPDSIIKEVNFMDNPWFPDVLKKEMEYDKQIDIGKYKHVWLGDYADVQSGKMYSDDMLEWQRQFFQSGTKLGGWTVFATYNPKYRYAIGADVSEGVGLDSSTACILNLTLGEVVAEYASNEIEPDLFGHELFNFSNKYGGCIIGVERNNCGLTTVTKLAELNANQYYEEEKQTGQSTPTKRLGWRTTGASKPLMLFDLKDALMDKTLKIISEPMFKELKTYNPEDIRSTRFDPEQTRHWDRVMALAIAYQMRGKAWLYQTAAPSRETFQNVFDRFSVV